MPTCRSRKRGPESAQLSVQLRLECHTISLEGVKGTRSLVIPLGPRRGSVMLLGVCAGGTDGHQSAFQREVGVRGPANDKSSWPFELQTQLVLKGAVSSYSISSDYAPDQLLFEAALVGSVKLCHWQKTVHPFFRVEDFLSSSFKSSISLFMWKVGNVSLHCKWWHIYQVFSDINHHRAHRAISDTLHVFRELLGLSLSLDQITRTPGRKRWTPHENLIAGYHP